MFGLLDWVKIGGGVIVGATLAYGPAYLHGKSAGRQEAAVASLSKSVEVLRERNVINDEVSASDAADLCRSYGLSENDLGECMRRVVDADANSGNSR